MKIEIKEQQEIIKEIEVDLPYYYEQDLDSDYGDHIIYGKITETESWEIWENLAYNGEIKYELKYDSFKSIKQGGVSGYFKKDHESSEKKYQEVLARAKEFLNKF